MMSPALKHRSGIHDGLSTRPARRKPGRLSITPFPETYLTLARDYERRTEMFPGWRERLVDMLAPHQGDTVLDVGCGPGLNIPALRARVGWGGRIIGIDDSPQLLTVAAYRVTRRGWDNVTLINSPVEAVQLPNIDAALFCAAYAVLQSPTALGHILQRLDPGAKVAAGGWKCPSRWLWPLRGLVIALNRPYVADFTGFDRPWQLLADQIAHLQVTEVGFGSGYLAHGRTRTVRASHGPRRPPNERSQLAAAHLSERP